MGNGVPCPHKRFDATFVDEKVYDNGGLWNFQMGTLTCKDCLGSSRAIRYVGKITKHVGRWKLFDSWSCDHSQFDVDDKSINTYPNKYFSPLGFFMGRNGSGFEQNLPNGKMTATAHCVKCERDVAVETTYNTQWKDGRQVNLYQSWSLVKKK
ncbi:MAG: hypothetical protein Dasosvirus1_9 [Dasosvirus sp.]|uniref:Uncharacterized protein n=1 Tax=Dasosvirus sp. TaxID=2487764 RepID=A0A3G4ZST1_9VIRU|nr:MAG: hypothetical protein Dasosvirus1_9 [Dasosvirus sp.]